MIAKHVARLEPLAADFALNHFGAAFGGCVILAGVGDALVIAKHVARLEPLAADFAADIFRLRRAAA